MNPTLPDIQDADLLPMVVLASASPRRRAMFESIGVKHRVLPASIDDGELNPGNVDPAEWVAALAFLKASSSAHRYESTDADNTNETLIIGADTVCVHDGEILGQPNDREHAREMILAMSQAVHTVMTGVAIIDPTSGKRELFVDVSVVTVGEIPHTEIEAYLDSEMWQGKAGGYNITERLAAGWPITFTGDETSIVGLPIARTIDRVSRFFVD
tara:strand:+ start:338 stop:979 length:642 start_codon:yes stop_codon:yes gene_type:complete